MDIQLLGLMSSLAAQGNINSIVGKGNRPSFSQIFSAIRGTDQISVEDMFSAAFPANDVSIKVGNCDVADEIWERKDFPFWQYFRDDVSADSLNNWKPAGAAPTGAEPYIQRELSKVAFGKMVVIIPESLQKKMEADAEYAQKIVGKLQRWKTNYDRMDNAVAFSYGDDPMLFQITKRYCIQLDEDGNIKQNVCIGGGMDTKRSDDTNSFLYNEAVRRIVLNTVKPKYIQGGIADAITANAITGFEEVDYTSIAPFLAAFMKRKIFKVGETK